MIRESLPSLLHNGKRRKNISVMVFLAPWPFTVTPFSRFSAFGEDRQTTFDCDICIHISFLAGPLHCLFVSQCLRLLLVSGFCCCVAVQHQSSTDSLARLFSAHSSWLPYEHHQNLWYSSWTPQAGPFTYWKEWWAVKTLWDVKEESESLLTVVEN